MSQPFLSTLLLDGKHSICASAGTGKTFVLCRLFLRMLLEKGMEISEILVVTFTEAATNELRLRIRELLRHCLKLIMTDRLEMADPELGLILEAAKRVHGAQRSANILKHGLASFDRAAICTIHSFCGRVLNSYGFETSTTFNTKIITDASLHLEQMTLDFWREIFAVESVYLYRHAMRTGCVPSRLRLMAERYLSDPHLSIIPEVEPVDYRKEKERYEFSVKELLRNWEKQEENVAVLLNSDSLKKNSYSPAAVKGVLQEIGSFLLYGHTDPAEAKKLSACTTTSLQEGTKKGQMTPSHPFFDACENLIDSSRIFCMALDTRLNEIMRMFFPWMRSRFGQRKKEQRCHTFDDLLLNVYFALHQDKSDALISSIRKRYKAALIDEFQDTDQVQTFIFTSIFGKEETPFFLIGDPKQSIYSFRQANIFSVLGTMDKVGPGKRHTLSVNYRSVPDMVTAINTLFQASSSPFIYENIPYEKVHTPENYETAPAIRQGGSTKSALEFWYFPASCIDPEAKPWSISREKANSAIVSKLASGINELFINGEFIYPGEKGKEKKVMPEDIAVLVRTRLQARLVREGLEAFGIPAVLCHSGSVFNTDEAADLHTVLFAIANPGNSGFLAAALVTDYFGYTADTLRELKNRDREYQEVQEAFYSYREIWESHGVLSALNKLMRDTNAPARFAGRPGGDRKLTNALHLQEMLQKQCEAGHMSHDQLLRWLSARISSDEESGDADAVRISHDDSAVKIVTIHAAKGLQYPVVFCPFCWGAAAGSYRDSDVVFHDPENGYRRTLDLGSEEIKPHRTLMECEQLSEELRLLYVALTRARSKCYCVWGSFTDAKSSGLGYLLHGYGLQNSRTGIAQLESHIKGYSEEMVCADLFSICERSDNRCGTRIFTKEDMDRPIVPYSPAVNVDQATLTLPVFDRILKATNRLTSFSALSRASHDPELPDSENTVARQVSTGQDGVYDIFSFPAGADGGSALHGVLERFDFSTADMTSLSDMVTGQLACYGIGSAWTDPVIQLLDTVRKTRLPYKEEPVVLGQVKEQDIVREMEFHYPVSSIDPAALCRVADLLVKDYEKHASPAQFGNFTEVNGYMHGFIDMFFRFKESYFLIDWKSNYIGDSLQDYRVEALVPIMIKNHYLLQSSIYTYAINRYLESRLPGYSYQHHFGGVYYIFLRGLQPDGSGSTGIFFHKPAEQVLNALGLQP